jgi:SAM-dependent methyltransferase
MSFKVYYFKPRDEGGFSEYWRKGDLREHAALVDAETTLSVVVGYMPDQGAILDAGCGVGRWTSYLRNKGYRAIGLDKNRQGLTMGRANVSQFPAVCADVLQTPFRDKAFGAVISFGLVEHFEQGPSGALAEVHRIVRPGGLVLVSVPYNNLVRKLVVNPLYRLRNMKRRLLGYELAFSEYRFSAREMRGFLKESGFEVCACYPDEFVPPKSKGLFIDTRILRGGLPETTSWEVGRISRTARRILDGISPWLCCGGVLCVGRRV